MKPVSMRIPFFASPGLAFAAAVLIASLLGFASAHATVVFGTLTVDPNPPPAGATFQLELTLDDPTGTPVEDAVVIAELTPIVADEPLDEIDPEAEPLVTTRFAETQPGTYRAEASVPSSGAYRVFLRDQTFSQEEATQILRMPIGTEQQVDPIDFLFPPTATGGGVSVWLLWLVAIPLIAGIVVTILVLRSGPPRGAGTEEPDGPEPKRETPSDLR